MPFTLIEIDADAGEICIKNDYYPAIGNSRDFCNFGLVVGTSTDRVRVLLHLHDRARLGELHEALAAATAQLGAIIAGFEAEAQGELALAEEVPT